jgi:hypothetical protein
MSLTIRQQWGAPSHPKTGRKTMNKHVKRIVGIVAMGFLAIALQGSAVAGPGPIARSSDAAWWQWALAIDAAQNPLLDETGQYCALGQGGHEWYLAGTFTGETVERTCSVPVGTWLFFPIVNSIWIDTPNEPPESLCYQGGVPQLDFGRAYNKAFVDAATNVSASLDGHGLPLTRLQSDVFDVALPADNLFSVFLGCPPAGTYQAVDDGWYAKVGPLSRGNHQLKLTGQSGGFVIDVTYHLIVTPGR